MRNRWPRTAFPLPPIAAQNDIVLDLETEQGLVAANRAFIERFEKKIQSTIERVWRKNASALAEA